MKKKIKEKESVYHFVTVIGCILDETNSVTIRDYEKAIQYTLDFIKYRFDPKNVGKIK
jgi:hypothetical protein